MKTTHSRNADQVMVRKLFGTDVSIADYDTMHSAIAPERQTDANFIKFTWVDISNKNIDDEDLRNENIREAQNRREEDFENLEISTSRGWNSSFFPPCYGTDGKFRDGRGRVITAINAGEKYIIVALYEYEEGETPVTNYLVNGLLANADHPPATLSKMNDFIEFGVSAILAGELSRTYVDVEDFLVNKCQVLRRFSGNHNGIVTKIINSILDRAKSGLNGATVIKKDDKAWTIWLNDSLGKNKLYWQKEYQISNEDDFVFHKSGSGGAERILTRHILPNASMGVPTKIILYAGETRDEVIRAHVNFEEALQEYYKNTYKWINHEISGIELKHDINSPLWKIVGVIPQFLNDDLHESCYRKGILVSMEEIRKMKKNTLSNHLSLVDD